MVAKTFAVCNYYFIISPLLTFWLLSLLCHIWSYYKCHDFSINTTERVGPNDTTDLHLAAEWEKEKQFMFLLARGKKFKERRTSFSFPFSQGIWSLLLTRSHPHLSLLPRSPPTPPSKYSPRTRPPSSATVLLECWRDPHRQETSERTRTRCCGLDATDTLNPQYPSNPQTLSCTCCCASWGDQWPWERVRIDWHLPAWNASRRRTGAFTIYLGMTSSRSWHIENS